MNGHHTTIDALYGHFVPNSVFRDLIACLNVTSASDLADENSEGHELQHTNEMLERFGFSDGAVRANLLKSYNGDYQYGATIVKAAYHVVTHFDLGGSCENTPSQTQNIFLAVAKLIHQNDVRTTSFIVEMIGIKNIPNIVEKIRDYNLLQIGSEICLVPRNQLDRITKVRDIQMLSSPRGPYLMSQLGFEPQDIGGVKVYVRPRANGGQRYVH